MLIAVNILFQLTGRIKIKRTKVFNQSCKKLNNNNIYRMSTRVDKIYK